MCKYCGRVYPTSPWTTQAQEERMAKMMMMGVTKMVTDTKSHCPLTMCQAQFQEPSPTLPFVLTVRQGGRPQCHSQVTLGSTEARDVQ